MGAKPRFGAGIDATEEAPTRPREFDLDNYRSRVRRLRAGGLKEEAEEALEAAEVACKLSRGRDASRARVWRQEHAARWNKLDAILERAERG